MTAAFENIVQHLFHQPSLHSVTVEELQRLVQQNPSFAAAQYLLLKKMQDTAHPDFNSQLKKTSLFFHNPLWLQFLLQPQREKMASPVVNETILTPTTEESFSETSSVDEQGVLIEKEQGHPELDNPPIETIPVASHLEANTSNAETSYNQSEGLTQSDESTELKDSDIESENHANLAISTEGMQESPAVELPAADGPLQEDTAHFSTIDLAEAYHHTTTTDQHVDSFALPETEEVKESSGHFEEAPKLEEHVIADAHLNAELTPSLVAHHEETIVGPATDSVNDSPEIIIEAPQPVEHVIEEAHLNTGLTPGLITHTHEVLEAPVAEPSTETGQEIASQKEKEGMAAAENSVIHEGEEITSQITAENKEALVSEKPLLRPFLQQRTPQHDDLLFEPYHTIDYFASQGININKIEPEPTDRFGKQLKSFTEWLKGMKKLPQASVDTMMAENEESRVVAAAFHSVETKEIITETMAEVFEKQGLKEKALDVYTKLSLQNPSKSAYFASKIEALKQ